ncbi:MAG: SDR family NAD(P)-dependent oxidoreductase [Marivivens sp.]|jgi:short-subunit dehydrogenase|uniref:SDR family NAD(P)-dependent oxidoreductase n=1 Tax=Marivivens sp. TaxID=1978374 RepID=UPI001790509F|nr:SDR family NAD(P)-dependent oxidoreductase [Marivivens sp.]MCL7404676.1 SDR family NAD(P)-dependent oxidoreductase [Marivivens geojensis]NBQ49242.1 SDR family NAD(P)-dependent oxidoreductase [Marivivens sp.]NBT50278.1 SDR family NAD(P)-dependent oxidoreductase [Marivivens sp.]NBX08518.1 SDR family NAD(P)-dependent oxidoreductase [Marivivens sp.]NCW67329.1 SDR family NAD(P)-dependent oxidoreductase [Marivivens sp.]
MRDWAGKTYWLIGASEGLGRALAEIMSDAGADLILSARSEERLREVADGLSRPARILPVDVSDAENVRAVVTSIGSIDGVVFLAGVYWPMAATEWSADEAETMVDVNLMGAMRVLGATVPDMVQRNAGHIVLTGSLSGFRGLPGAIGYSASKAGIMSLAETMKSDLKRTGVEVQVVNPGFIRTRLTDKNTFNMPFIMSPEDAARVMFEHMNSRKFKRSFPTVFSWFFRASQLMPDWLYFRIF